MFFEKSSKGSPLCLCFFWKKFQRVPPLLIFFEKSSKGSPLCLSFLKKFQKQIIKGGSIGFFFPSLNAPLCVPFCFEFSFLVLCSLDWRNVQLGVFCPQKKKYQKVRQNFSALKWTKFHWTILKPNNVPTFFDNSKKVFLNGKIQFTQQIHRRNALHNVKSLYTSEDDYLDQERASCLMHTHWTTVYRGSSNSTSNSTFPGLGFESPSRQFSLWFQWQLISINQSINQSINR